jgi:hypothetical protein
MRMGRLLSAAVLALGLVLVAGPAWAGGGGGGGGVRQVSVPFPSADVLALFELALLGGLLWRRRG